MFIIIMIKLFVGCKTVSSRTVLSVCAHAGMQTPEHYTPFANLTKTDSSTWCSSMVSWKICDNTLPTPPGLCLVLCPLIEMKNLASVWLCVLEISDPPLSPTCLVFSPLVEMKKMWLCTSWKSVTCPLAPSQPLVLWMGWETLSCVSQKSLLCAL